MMRDDNKRRCFCVCVELWVDIVSTFFKNILIKTKYYPKSDKSLFHRKIHHFIQPRASMFKIRTIEKRQVHFEDKNPPYDKHSRGKTVSVVQKLRGVVQMDILHNYIHTGQTHHPPFWLRRDRIQSNGRTINKLLKIYPTFVDHLHHHRVDLKQCSNLMPLYLLTSKSQPCSKNRPNIVPRPHNVP